MQTDNLRFLVIALAIVLAAAMLVLIVPGLLQPALAVFGAREGVTVLPMA